MWIFYEFTPCCDSVYDEAGNVIETREQASSKSGSFAKQLVRSPRGADGGLAILQCF